MAAWLRRHRPQWGKLHILELGLQGSADAGVFNWTQVNKRAMVIFDRDFADRRTFAVGEHCGIVCLRIRPPMVEETRRVLEQLLGQMDEADLHGTLAIVDRTSTRIRLGPPTEDV